MLEGTNAEGLNGKKKKRVAGEAASAERRNKSDSFDSWVMATEGETGGKKRGRKNKPEEWPRLERLAPGLYESQHGGRARPVPFDGIRLSLGGWAPILLPPPDQGKAGGPGRTVSTEAVLGTFSVHRSHGRQPLHATVTGAKRNAPD